MNQISRDLLLLFLFVVSIVVGAASARAETIPATGTSAPNTAPIQYRLNNAGAYFSTATAACKSGQADTTAVLAISSNVYYYQCLYQYQGNWYHNGSHANYGCSSGVLNYPGLPSCGPAVVTYTCPAGQNWTLSGSNCTRPDCVSPNVRNSSTGVCEAPPCLSKAAVAPDSFYDYGTDPAGKFPSAVCVSGCLAIFSGTTPAGSAIIAGVKHYYGFGGYDFAGSGSSSSCTVTAATPSPSSALAAIPPSHCASDQIEGLINGKLNCWNVPAPGEAPTVAPTDAAVTSTTTASTTTSTVGDTTTTTNITNNSSGGQTTVQTVCTGANCTTTTTDTKPAEDPAEGVPVSGTLASVGNLADDDTRTFGSVWTERKNQLMATPLVGLASSLTSFPGGVGACPSWSVGGTVFGTTIGGDLSPPCWLWGVFRAILLLTSLFVARRLIFGG